MSLAFTRIVVDENIPKEIVDMLKGLGFKEVYWILEKRPGATDPEVWNLAASKRALLLTGDVGFIAQLDKTEIVNGPSVVQYSANGFSKNELHDPKVMNAMLDWLFRNDHHPEDGNYMILLLHGELKTLHQMWDKEKRRRAE
jgi:predicted nuclease of predicted toxin-antitoxin system